MTEREHYYEMQRRESIINDLSASRFDLQPLRLKMCGSKNYLPRCTVLSLDHKEQKIVVDFGFNVRTYNIKDVEDTWM